MTAAASALRCRICEHVEASGPANDCSRCDGPTDVVYDLVALSKLVTPGRIADSPRAMWRYRDLLPAEVVDATSAVGWTPLLHAEVLSKALEVDIRLKLETDNPTGSYKDRTAALAGAAAGSRGFETLCCASDGPLGDAVAAEAAAHRREAIVLAPATVPAAHTRARSLGAQVIALEGSHDDCLRLARELSTQFPWGFLAGNLRPYAVEGTKTIAFEIAEQLGWRLPSVVVSAIASGTLFAKLAQGFHELSAVGLVHDAAPRLIGAQSSGRAPVAAAYAEGRSLAIDDPVYGDLALGAARGSGGAVVAVDERAVGGYVELVALATGQRVDESAGIALGAVVESARSGLIRKGETVVLVVSGSAAEPARPPDEPVRSVPPRLDRVLQELGAD
jgi:threonine synthase